MVTCCIIVKRRLLETPGKGGGVGGRGEEGQGCGKGETKRKGENLVQFKGTVS